MTTATTATGALGTESALSNWAGPYVTNMLGKAEALSSMPYQTYQGPLTAWSSPLQEQGFQQAGQLSTPGAVGQATTALGGIADLAKSSGTYNPTTFMTDMFGNAQAQQYMNPYLQSALNPMMDEARRQADIARLSDAARLTKAGAYGGSRQAIMESEGRRNLMDKQNQMLTQGYNTAYDKAQRAFTDDQTRYLDAQKASELSRQFGAKQGLDALKLSGDLYGSQGRLGLDTAASERANLDSLMRAGETQRGITSEGIKADYNEFLNQRDYPMKMLQFQQSMLQGMPLESRSYAYEQPSNLQQTVGTLSGLLGLYQKLFPGG